MADISKLRIKENIYNIKDAKAREDLKKIKPPLNVTTTTNPIYPNEFICDYSYNEIRNAIIEKRTVTMYFEDIIENSGNQVYQFLKLTKDGAYFRRNQTEKEYIRQIDIKVSNGKQVTFQENYFYKSIIIIKTNKIASRSNIIKWGLGISQWLNSEIENKNNIHVGELAIIPIKEETTNKRTAILGIVNDITETYVEIKGIITIDDLNNTMYNENTNTLIL